MSRLFTVLYFSVRSSRSRALRYGLPSCLRVKTTKGAGAVSRKGGGGGGGGGGGVSRNPPPPPPRAIIPDARPLGTFENQVSCDGKTQYI